MDFSTQQIYVIATIVHHEENDSLGQNVFMLFGTREWHNV